MYGIILVAVIAIIAGPATAHVHMAALAMVTVQLFALRRQSLFMTVWL